MESRWLESSIRASNRRLLFVTLILMALTAGVFAIPTRTEKDREGATVWRYGLSIATVLCGLSAISRLGGVKHHPAYVRLRRYGNPDEVCDSVDREVDLPQTLKVGSLIVGPSWLMRRGFLAIDVVRLDEVAWAHRKETTVRGPVGRPSATNEALIYLKDGRNIKAGGTAGEVGEMLAAIVSRVPWITVGYSKTLAQAWARDRKAFVAHVESQMKKLTET